MSEMKNENGQIKRKTAPTSESESRKSIRIEANSHQNEYNFILVGICTKLTLLTCIIRGYDSICSLWSHTHELLKLANL